MTSPAADTRTAKHRLLDRILADKGHGCLADIVKAGRADGTSLTATATEVTTLTGEACSAQNLLDWLGPFGRHADGGAA